MNFLIKVSTLEVLISLTKPYHLSTQLFPTNNFTRLIHKPPSSLLPLSQYPTEIHPPPQDPYHSSLQ